ncbi:hypothetical protein EDB80DRAFT_714414 [Ilyonectria destructans]|nr:hypothetical protein EDB80DRAFT_714414 [Ilyonectria destructans]
MGRTEPSVGQPPASFRRDARSKKAKVTINQLIPSLLPTHPRARRGIEAAELIVSPPLQNQEQSSDIRDGPRLTLRVADTLTAAHSLLNEAASPGDQVSHGRKVPKVAILNMASPLSPGGGFLNGASSQEESLCMRTTLLASLKDEYYRLPELGAVYTPDVLVFRDEAADELLEKKDRWFVDCITAAMLRGPETDRDDAGRGSYANEKDRELVVQKMKMVLRICQAKGVTKVVLGAWGCGAYGNPVGEIAAAWRKVLLPRKEGKNKNKKETWDGLDDVVFAIKDAGMAESFGAAFGDGLLRETPEIDEAEEDEELDPEEVQRQELQAGIDELELRIETTTNQQVKSGLCSIRSGLISQLPKGQSTDPVDDL